MVRRLPVKETIAGSIPAAAAESEAISCGDENKLRDTPFSSFRGPRQSSAPCEFAARNGDRLIRIEDCSCASRVWKYLASWRSCIPQQRKGKPMGDGSRPENGRAMSLESSTLSPSAVGEW